MYEIVKGRPIPSRQGAQDKYGFGRMDVGDMIEVPANERKAATTAYCYHQKAYGKKFKSMLLDSGKVGVWRMN